MTDKTNFIEENEEQILHAENLSDMAETEIAEMPPVLSQTETANNDSVPMTDESAESISESTADSAVEAAESDTASQTESEPEKKPKRRRKTAVKDEEFESVQTQADAAAQTDVEQTPPVAEEPEKVEKSESTKKSKKRITAKPAQVLSIDDRRTVETDEDKAKNDLLDLLESLRTGRILTGTIQGVERASDNQSMAVVYHGAYKIVIPAEDLQCRRSRYCESW